MLSKLRERRATYLNTANSDDMQLNAKKTQVIRQQYDDATAVIDLAPTHSTPDMVRNARVMRVSACGFLNYPDVKKKGTEREKKIALEDVQLVLSDPDATGLGISYSVDFG